AQITRENVEKLRVAWVYHSGEHANDAVALQVNTFEATPLHTNASLYLCTRLGKIVALNPATGHEKWRFDPHTKLVTEERRAGNCRGVAYWQDAAASGPCAKRVYRTATTAVDTRLFAV